MNIVVLGGAGLMGTGVVRDLVSDTSIVEFNKITIADLDENQINAFIAELGDDRLTGCVVDVSDTASLAAVLEDASICINSVPTLAGYQMNIFNASLQAKVPYIDLGGLGIYTLEQKAMHKDFVEAGVPAVIGVGADPGMSNVLCRAVADELDTIDTLNLYWAAEYVGDENPILVPPYSISTVLAEYAHPSTQFLDGRHVQCAPLTGTETLDLPEPWGRAEFMYSPHSEQLTVPVAEGIKEKGIKEFTWKLHLPHREHEAWVGLVKAGFGDFDDEISVKGQTVKPLDVLSAVIQRNIERNKDKIPAQESHEIHFVIGKGTIAGKVATVRGEVIVQPDSRYDDYIDAATSMNASISAQLLLLDKSKAGVWAPEEFFDTERYFEEVKKRGFSYRLEVQ